MKLSKITPVPQIEVLHGGKIMLGKVGISDCSIVLKAKNSSLAAEALEMLKKKLKSTLFLNILS